MADVGGIPSEGGEGYENEEQFFMKTGYIVMLSMIWVFILSASIIEHLHFGYIHETGVVIIIGVCISLISKFWGYNEMNTILEFNENIFFYVWLPPLVFASGYNMKRKNSFNILIIFLSLEFWEHLFVSHHFQFLLD